MKCLWITAAALGVIQKVEAREIKAKGSMAKARAILVQEWSLAVGLRRERASLVTLVDLAIPEIC